MAQRDSAVSDYRSCAEEPPAPERSSVGAEIAHGAPPEVRRRHHLRLTEFY